MLPLESRESIVEVFGDDPDVHVYGLADLEMEYWDRSLWWQRGDAVVGLIGLPAGLPPIVYAVSVKDPEGTLALLLDVDDQLPSHYVMTGPPGTADALARRRSALWSGPHEKMAFDATLEGAMTTEDAQVVFLDPANADEYQVLLDTDENAGDFFHAGLLDSGLYVGVRRGGKLVSGAGVHVTSDEFSVAAIGNVVTHPAHRKQGLGALVTGTLAVRLAKRFSSVGLNVQSENQAAASVYRSLGFHKVCDYEEAELIS